MLERVMDGGQPSCSRENFDECIYKVVNGKMMEEAGCTVPWTRNNTK